LVFSRLGGQRLRFTLQSRISPRVVEPFGEIEFLPTQKWPQCGQMTLMARMDELFS
jgi:hypothetical protein